MQFRLTLSLITLLAMAACGGSKASPTAPGATTTTTPPVASSRGSMSALVNGVQWTATSVTTLFEGGSVLSVVGSGNVGSGTGSGAAVSFTGLETMGRPGTFALNQLFSNVNLSASFSVLFAPDAGYWTIFPTGTSGSITVTTLTATGASGTFFFTLLPLAGTGATGTKFITNGVFNVTF